MSIRRGICGRRRRILREKGMDSSMCKGQDDFLSFVFTKVKLVHEFYPSIARLEIT